MEINRAIEVLKTTRDCCKKYRRMRPYPRTCDECIHADKCYTPQEEDKSLELATVALERQEETEQKRKKFEEIREIVMNKMTDIALSEDDTCEKNCGDCPHRICGRNLEEAEQGCNICNSDEIGKLLIKKDLNTEYLAFVGGNSKFPKKNHAKFCPKCGRKLEG